MSILTRREFIHRSIAGAGAIATAPVWASEEKASGKTSATDRIEVGDTGIKLSRIAMGTGSNGYNKQSDQTRLGMKKFAALLRHGYDSGLNFFDTADLYGSHPYMKNVLKSIPREKVVILSKIWFQAGGAMRAAEAARPEIERFRQELGTDVIDIALIHCVTAPAWPDELKRIRDEMTELKDQRVIRAKGCSCHSIPALQTAAEDPWVDVIFARINDKQKKMDGKPSEVATILKRARANGKFVVGMKLYGCGELTTQPDRDESLRYVLGNNLVDAMTIGFTHTPQIDDSIAHVTRLLNSRI